MAAACAHPAGSGFVERKLHEVSSAAVGVARLKWVPAPVPCLPLVYHLEALQASSYCLVLGHSLNLSDLSTSQEQTGQDL